MSTASISAKTPRASKPTLDDHLDRHWNGEQLLTMDELPPDPSTLSASARFAAEVEAAAPKWVMLPVPPAKRDVAKRHTAALRRRGLEAAMRPHPESSTAWAIWAKAKQPAARANSRASSSASTTQSSAA
jgi:hypothetical protein